MKTLLLTGWTGYIGSHNAVLFLQAGYEVLILDNLSNATEEVIEKIERISGKKLHFYKGDLRNTEDVEKVFRAHTIDAVIHFAGAKAVGESCEKPYYYYENNILWSVNLFECMEQHGVKDIIFSSSATVYNPLSTPPFSEESPTGNTTNPYGTTKFIIENILRDLALHKDFRVMNLRYFNPIWAHSSWLIGENPNDIPNNLLPYIMKVASGELEQIQVFGDDYDTIDGTGVRDYIHVMDLAEWHVAALKYMEKTAGSIFENINLGTGNGTSVLEMIEYANTATAQTLAYKMVERRSGDIASAYCNPEKAEKLLEWKAQKSVSEWVQDSWNFICNLKK